MPVDKLINILVFITLIQLMVTIGLGVTIQQVAAVATNWRMVGSAAIANYVLVPACAVVLLTVFQSPPLVAAGFLITAACPGAPYAPPYTGVAKGNVPVAVGLMALLAGSSALVAPLILSVALPLVARDEILTINAFKMDETLFVTQLLPMAAGMAIRALWPKLAEYWIGPSKRLSLFLNVAVVGLIVASQYRLFLAIRPAAFAGMLALILASLGFGWLLGGKGEGDRVAMAFSTGVRNFGVSLVIATTSFPGTQAVTVALVYGLFQTIVLALAAAGWGHWAMRPGRAARKT
jgi:BASS family bile acid:Na+ symporter